MDWDDVEIEWVGPGGLPRVWCVCRLRVDLALIP